MDFPYYYLLPLASAILYPVGSLFLKQAIAEGAGSMRTIFLSNLAIAICFLPLLAWNAERPHWHAVGWPVATGIVFFLGQTFTVLALRVGDVSVQAPLMGTKTVFVALASALLQPASLAPALWLGAAITAVAVFLLGGGDRATVAQSLGCVLLSLLSAALFGLTDTLLVAKSPAFGRLPYIVVMTATLGVLSLGMIPFFRSSLAAIPRAAWIPALGGSFTIALQAMLLGIALSFFGRATEMNILYSSRGLWGVLLVWFAGHLFANKERHHAGREVMRRRLTGALLLCAAIVLVFV